MHPKTSVGLLFLLIFVVFGFSKNNNPNPDQQKKEQIIRSINLLRAAHKQPALTFEGVFRQPQSATLNKGAGGGSISGRISGNSDNYFQSLTVVAWNRDGQSNDSTADSIGVATVYFGKIESDGNYTIQEMEPGEYFVLATADNYIPTYYNNVTDFSAASTVQVIEGGTVPNIDFFLEKYNSGQASISGKVVAQYDGHPIANANVNVFSPDIHFFYGWTETNLDGSYEITGLKSGKYFAYVWAEGYLNEYYKEAESFDLATTIDVLEPNHYNNIDFSLSRGGMISGKVTTENGKPLPGINVQAYTDNRNSPENPPSDSSLVYGYGTALTGVDGSYLISGLPAGEYLISAQIVNQWFYKVEFYDNVTDINEATPVMVETDVETPGINFDLDLPYTFGSIFGKVVDTDAQPIAGAIVQVHAPFNESTAGLKVWAYGYTDHLGNYHIDNLPDGEYLVSAYAQVSWQYVNRYWPDAETPEKAEPVIVDGTSSLATNFQLPVRPGTASISGQVLLNSGEPAVYATIQLSSYNNNTNPNNGSIRAYATTDSSGSYRIDQLPEGDYAIYTQYWKNQNFAQQWFDHKDSRSEANAIVLAAGEQRRDINFDLTLRPYYGTIAGNVSNELDGTPIARAYVEITPLGFNYHDGGFDRFSFWPGFFTWPYHAITNEQGNYLLEWLPEGEYYVSVYSDGAFEYYENVPVAELAVKVRVTGGETSAVNFGLTARNEGSGIISGKVSDEWNSGGLPIAIVVARPTAVALVWPDSEEFFNTITKIDGSYELTGLPAGEYYLFAFSPGYIGEYYDNGYDPSEAKVITVVENQPVTGIDFTLSPILWVRGCPECDFGGPEQAGGGQVFGKVTDGNGNVIQNASIYLLDDSGKPVSFAQSNAEGVYELRSVPPGFYRIKAAHLKYKGEFNNGAADFADAQVIEVGNGTLEINFELDAVTGITDNLSFPKTILLYGNYPNPFNPATTIEFDLPKTSDATLKIFNILGEEVAMLVAKRLSAGSYSYQWDASNMPSGLYLYRLEAEGFVATKKMILMK